ncbi:MAG: KH domain-containing protein [Erysipelothrix sp.]|nr:KH domain-containing protein [Erysipelothrix sp.]
MDAIKILYDLVEPVVQNKDALSVKELPSLNENETILVIYADSNDVGRLIGKKGTMANAIRQTMGIATRVLDRKITVKFESY